MLRQNQFNGKYWSFFVSISAYFLYNIGTSTVVVLVYELKLSSHNNIHLLRSQQLPKVGGYFVSLLSSKPTYKVSVKIADVQRHQ